MTESHLLQEGQSLSFVFSQLPLLETSELTFAGSGSFQFYVLLDWGDSFRCDLYENNFSDAPILSTFSLAELGYTSFNPIAPYAWQDLQGAVRITMTKGSASFDGFTAYVGLAGSQDLHGAALQPIPEPPAIALFSIAMAGLALLRAQRMVLRHTKPNKSSDRMPLRVTGPLRRWTGMHD